MNDRERLIELYSNKSKHSNYQVLPNSIRSILDEKDIQTSSRYETERLDYIKENIDVKDKTLLDIGANTGYFSFELLDSGAKSVHSIEGNREHADFIMFGAKALGADDKLTVTNTYYEFDGSDNNHYDVGLLFNVLHHIGDDYGDDRISVEKAKETIIQQLNCMAVVSDMLVFQLGFNWQGNPTKPLFENGTKGEMIDFIKSGTADYWDILLVGVAEGTKNNIHYERLDNKNIIRNDELGEFLNRPIFILKSKR